MFQHKAALSVALLSLTIGISLFVYFAPDGFSEGTINGEETKDRNLPEFIESNMLDLEYQDLFTLDIRRTGGGIGATDNELILVTGDGQIRIVDLVSGENHQSAIELPENNEQAALSAARQVKEEERAEKAEREVKKWFRYDDILIFHDRRSLYLVLSYAYFDPQRLCFSHRVSALSVSLPTRLTEITASSNEWSLIFSSEPCFGFRERGHAYAGVQSGGRMDVVDENKGEVLLALGDYEFDGVNVPRYPQDLDADYGKILKLNIHNKSCLLYTSPSPRD